MLLCRKVFEMRRVARHTSFFNGEREGSQRKARGASSDGMQTRGAALQRRA